MFNSRSVLKLLVMKISFTSLGIEILCLPNDISMLVIVRYVFAFTTIKLLTEEAIFPITFLNRKHPFPAMPAPACCRECMCACTVFEVIHRLSYRQTKSTSTVPVLSILFYYVVYLRCQSITTIIAAIIRLIFRDAGKKSSCKTVRVKI